MRVWTDGNLSDLNQVEGGFFLTRVCYPNNWACSKRPLIWRLGTMRMAVKLTQAPDEDLEHIEPQREASWTSN